MFFLFGVSGVLLLLNFYHKIRSCISSVIANDTIINIGLKGFLYYTKLQLSFYQSYAFYYDNNDFFRHSINYMQTGYNMMISNMYNYKIEEVDAHWMNVTMVFRCNNDYARKIVPKMIENYDIVHNHENKEITDMVFQQKLMYFNHPDDANITICNPMIMYLIKYHDTYLCKHNCHGIYEQWCSDMKPVNDPFFEIEYVDESNNITQSIDLPRSFFIENNEILSYAFLRRWFDYIYTDNSFVFNDEYVINMTDDSFETVTITRNEYVLLESTGYSIQKIK